MGGRVVGLAMPSICFVAQRAYNLLTDRADVRHIGGAEAQQALLARELSKRGFDVSFVVHDHGQMDVELVDGIRLFKSYVPDDGWPGLRFFHPRLTGLWSALARADADIYYQRGAESETGLVGAWCRRNGRRFVFALAGHHVLSADSPNALGWKESKLFRGGLGKADLVLVQTLEQQALLREMFDCDSQVLRSACRIDGSSATESEKRSGVLWVGRFDGVKRLEWCLDVAERARDVRFTIVGASGAQSPRAMELQRHAERLANVTMAGYVRPDLVRMYYESAGVLLCTSISEGFPNTFLEAWQVGTPVVSTVDPDRMIVENELGRVASDPDGLAAAIGELRVGSEVWRGASAHCVEHVNRYHSLDLIASQLADCLISLPPRRRRADRVRQCAVGTDVRQGSS